MDNKSSTVPVIVTLTRPKTRTQNPWACKGSEQLCSESLYADLGGVAQEVAAFSIICGCKGVGGLEKLTMRSENERQEIRATVQ